MPRSSRAAPALVLFRRDLRLADHPALSAATETGAPVLPVYILDDETPGRWRMGGASRWWLHQSLRSLGADLEARGSRLVLRRGETERVLRDLIEETGARTIFFTRGYEPYQRALEERLKLSLEARGVSLRRFGGQILVEPENLANLAGAPFRVFTPFFRALSQRGEPSTPLPAPQKLAAPDSWPRSDALASWSLEPTKPDWARGIRAAWRPGETAARKRLAQFIETTLASYRTRRDEPGIDGTSRLSPHLAFGEIGPRQIWHAVQAAAEAAGDHAAADAYLREVGWREFSYHLLFHFPHLPEAPFRPEFEAFPWRDDETALEAWQRGRTGYPIVDAGMRQLWQTGWMHNRVRMIVASFLIKDLLLPWQTGADWFWDTLVDADLANNAASWQWVAGSGADAAPYFRIFNPVLQGEKFDARGDYVRAFVPELAKLPASLIHKPWTASAAALRDAGVTLGETWPHPIVDHVAARARALTAFASLKK
ncbi:deoxyribodipyrimidine photolyase [Rhodomicrobium udaipurense JA643]|uniref:Deoxyribodipyrimidine photo-lyase n=1 Tax=Rhodomicrobium udaipurense TaxID=1202716 RepID=A0A8I1KLD7_9HYPH|nr:deoxyribodipyrimidine photo-lyase [Rhodomicrobium udaipurense]KAI93392.1 deoxyribodipyrimidine photolyase [Rhodomicrobium udaipurense JA643]MBJ7543148.1 deoxyribodipyrimidine photo-lyase [Rhodomicrobium udaipurense]